LGTPTQTGSYPVTVTVTDENGCIGSQRYTLVIHAPPNLVVSANATPDPANVDDSVTVNATVNNSGGSIANDVSVQFSLPPGVTFNPIVSTPGGNQEGGVVKYLVGSLAAGASTQIQLVYTPGVAAAGKTLLTTVNVASTPADDPNGNTTVALTQVNPLFPPTISDIWNQRTDEDTPIVIEFTISDDGPTSDVNLTASSTNSELVPVSGIQLGGAGRDRTLRITPALDQFGSTVIAVTATDAYGLSTTERFRLFVDPVKDAPSPLLSIPPKTFTEGDQPSVKFVPIKLARALGTRATIVITTTSGTALAPQDVILLTPFITLGVGQTVARAALLIRDDHRVEGTESFRITATLQTRGTTLASATGTVTIVDDDGPGDNRADIDGDGDVDSDDRRIFGRALAAFRRSKGSEYDERADLNGDGKIDEADLRIFLKAYRARG
jgi:hypothetical protein